MAVSKRTRYEVLRRDNHTCRYCGGTAPDPSATQVEDVKALDLQWAGAIQRVALARARQRKKRSQYVLRFAHAWDQWSYGHAETPFPTPASWKASIERFYELGVPIEELEECVRIACGNDRIRADETFRYFAGCVWRVVKDMQDAAKELLDSEAVDGS